MLKAIWRALRKIFFPWLKISSFFVAVQMLLAFEGGRRLDTIAQTYYRGDGNGINYSILAPLFLIIAGSTLWLVVQKYLYTAFLAHRVFERPLAYTLIGLIKYIGYVSLVFMANIPIALISTAVGAFSHIGGQIIGGCIACYIGARFFFMPILLVSGSKSPLKISWDATKTRWLYLIACRMIAYLLALCLSVLICIIANRVVYHFAGPHMTTDELHNFIRNMGFAIVFGLGLPCCAGILALFQCVIAGDLVRSLNLSIPDKQTTLSLD